MENNIEILEPLLKKINEYGNTRYDLIKLKTSAKAIEILTSVATKGILLILIVSSFIILTIGIAFWLGEVLGKIYYGFFCIAGFYIIILGIVYLFMLDWLKKSISDSMVSKMFN